MELLPKNLWDIRLIENGKAIAAGIYENPPGYRYWVKYYVSDLPKDNISIEDLKRFGIGNFVNNLTV